jgi:chromosome segregation ATPase
LKSFERDKKTYSKKEVVELINTAGEGLLIKAEKIALETKISRLVSDIDYKREFIAFVHARTDEEEGRFLENKARLGEAKNQLIGLRQEAEATRAEVEKQVDMRKKAQATVKLRDEHAALAEKVRVLDDNLRQLKVRLDMDNIKAERVAGELAQKEGALAVLKSEIFGLKDRKEKCLLAMPEVKGPEDLPAKQAAARKTVAEFSGRIEKAREGLKEVTPRLPGLKTRAGELLDEKEALSSQAVKLEAGIAELSSLEKRDVVIAALEVSKKNRDGVDDDIKRAEQTASTLKTNLREAEDAIAEQLEFADAYRKRASELSAKRAEAAGLNAKNTVLLVENNANGKFIELLDPIAKYVGDVNRSIDELNREYIHVQSALMKIIEGGLK